MFYILTPWILALAFPLLIESQGTYSVNEEVGGRLSHYLKDLSSPKPLKCKTKVPKGPHEWSERKQWIQSRKCREGEIWNTFEFSGQIDDQNRLSGTGKFSFGSNGTTAVDAFLSTCFEFPTTYEKSAEMTSIVGTFVNGTLEGNAKVTFAEPKGFVISNFVQGVPHGFKRIFDSSKALISAETVAMGTRFGYHWNTRPGGNYLLDFEHTEETFEDATNKPRTLAFMPSSNQFISGFYPGYVDFLIHPYAPESLVFDHESKDCIKPLDWSKTDPQIEETFSLSNSSFISEIPKENLLPPDPFLSAPKQLLQFRKHLKDNEAQEVILRRDRVPPLDHKDKVVFLVGIVKVNGSIHADLQGENIILTHVSGFLDKEKRFHGVTELRVNGSVARDPIFNTTIFQIWAEFHHGEVKDGLIKVQLEDKRFGYVNVMSNMLHGPLIIHGAVPILPLKYVIRPYISETSSCILMYESGRRKRPFWIGMFGLGTLTGMLNSTGHVSGDDIAYIYPDMETSYVGRFENKLMREAYLSDIESANFDNVIPSLKFKKSLNELRPFYYEPPTNVSVGAGPEILDPYDQKRVYLSDAGEFGEGVHVNVDMEIGDIACLYSYHMYYPPDELAYRGSCTDNVSRSDAERRHCVKYALGMQIIDATINIPPQNDVPGIFFPTLGQKLNHNFYGSHASFVDFESPRWGMVSSIGLYNKPIKKGEQLFVNYGYRYQGKFPYDFPWFWEAKAKIDEARKEEAFKENMVRIKKMKKEKKKAQKKAKKAE